ncbi:cytidine deaminase [Pedobacter cryoconitis]|uniref:Cytidine deaminase n=1 Tax=Pedobacter cryoconitis TaxID=188932 RepID=A0A7W8YW83_9SPHI|nr:cytidine deaminase [Pedobacter cryoconitis]MBB5622695.1 cytidine deaminase [Pedobacter cryoconitis]MBB5648849.1 cytidine deaminase [Pedobacter cryoconitis]
MNNLNISIAYESYDQLEELNAADQSLCVQAKEALKTSYSPYSNFKVATAVRLNDGVVVSGSNQENLAYPSGLCAERVALFTIGATYPNAIIETMAITAHTDSFKIEQPITCCGACLQVMAEFERKQNKEIEVLFYCLDGKILKVKGIKSLLPFVFVEDRLAV